ncbi:hypothetical protein GCM10009844_22630 [Nocardioides koreensis]|uniref:Transposase n=1 Tax=Nocardioides koreensis TaxID=433651 RepID=A0ABP5LFT3_9ACTN
MSRHHYNTWTRVRAVLESPGLYELATGLDWDPPVGRPRANPTYVVLGFGVLARLARSGIRVELDLAEPHTWAAVRQIMVAAIARHGLDLPPPGPRPPKWDHWRWMRDYVLATDEGIADLGRLHPPIAVAAARRLGLLDPAGPGSFTHPHPSRAVYGDGTLVRPMYRPPETVLLDNDDGTQTPAYLDPATGALHPEPRGRFDPDLQPHHGKGGSVRTHGYVCWHTRGPRPYQRIDLACGHTPAPGAEAATAVALLREVHRAAGTGIQAVVYDGALRGSHIDQVMRDYGYPVLAKQATGTPETDAGDHLEAVSLARTPQGRRVRTYPLGTATHDLPTGPCTHQIATTGGQVVEIDLNEAGDPTIVATLVRRSVKRSRRANGRYRFNVGYELNCPASTFTIWLSPHATATDPSRPEQLRVLAPGDPDAQRLHGLRSDAEGFHSSFKRTLLVDRQMSLGWRRGLVDLYCFTLLNNALAEHRAAEEDRSGRMASPSALRGGG